MPGNTSLIALDRLSPIFQIIATTITVIIIVIHTGTLTGFCHTRNTNNGPKAQAKTDQEKITKANTLLFVIRAIANTIVVTTRVAILAFR